MKDEEMAEEYTKKEGFRSGMFGELDNITSSEANKEIKQAFLAGLKVGRPQWHKVADGYIKGYLAGLHEGQPKWHDLRKDPNDLPKHSVRVLVLLEDKLYEISSISADNRWVCTDYYTGEDKVIAWCEIPQFKE